MPVKKVTDKKEIKVDAEKVVKQAQTKIAAASPRNDDKKATKTSVKKNALSVPVYSLLGKEEGKLDLPEEIFGKEINKSLLAQASRVYMTNQKNMTASTKTRGEVRGSTAKVYRQKGTGRARHGSIKAPIYVGGGIVFGPQNRNVRLDLPKKMKRAALLVALSAKAKDSEIFGLSGLDKATGKTKEMASLAKSLNFRNALVITSEKQDNVVRGVRNIRGFDVTPANLLNAYEVIRHQMIFITKEAVDKISGKGEEIKK